MNPMDLPADFLHRDLEMFKATVADFSDADFFVRPCPAANHTAWQLGHLIGAELWMINAIAPGTLSMPEGYDKKFSKETASKDDPAFFPTGRQLLDQLTKTRAATVAWVKTLSPESLMKPTPESMQKFAPTVAHVLHMAGTHLGMHMGQMQVVRRKLGKPVLF